MFEIGRICVKIAGRDAGKKCAIVDVVDANFVIVDGDARRKKCNVKHLEPLDTVIKLEKGASHSVVSTELKKIGIEVTEKKQAKQKTVRPKKAKKKSAPIEAKPKKAKENKAEKKPAE